ncbi:pentapeptide repeat-containing protein [Halomicronema sp. CCY15110]|uniref:pentapeptide repeat-containing protein n=1 Tax=Halomicronema sp. CCY15110 TaxID=2767773 RepID=UPI0019513FF2|nr:pentapeptide repeat-containing protein [Halomicronema sp. CCY15110]
MASRLWKFLNTDIQELVSLDTVEESKDAADAVLGLAEALQSDGPNVQQLAPLVTQLDSLLDVLNSPLGNIVGAGLPFVPIATGLLKVYLEKTKQEPTLSQSVALMSQAAYLESFKDFVQHQPKVQKWLAAADKRARAKDLTPEVKALGDFELSDREARFALLHFHQSALAISFNRALIARLVHLGAKLEAAKKIAEMVSQNTNRHMRAAIADADAPVQRIVEWYRIGGDADFEKYLSIDTYLAEAIAPRPHEPVFAEPFAFKDIYVPLKAQPLTGAGEIDESQAPIVLEQWARQMLHDDEQKSRVMFVQGGPGRGKSVFCRMFADWVRRHEHPRWTPILIRLRDVSVLSRDFEETLAKAVDRDFAKTDSGWLTDRNVNFLFILDGFDELLMEGRTSGGLDHFLAQIGRFQEQCARNSEKNHRVLITGRTLALQSIESRMPSNLARIEIQPMDDELQLQWFDLWGDLIGQDKSHLMAILQDERLPERVRELAREPLLLYLLAAMHRDGELRLDMFAGAEGAQAKVLIYERTLEWVLTKQRPEWLNQDLTEIEISGLRRILQEAGLCVVQSGMEFASIGAIEDRLSQDSTAKVFLEEAQKRLKTDDTPLRNALAAFYLQEGRQGEGSIEFVHKSFGEFLCAERIVNSLIDICQPGRNREYDIDDPAFCWTMYDLLGCHVLTPEIVEYLTALLTKHPEFEAEKLHQRLHDFYWRWSDGEFIDAPPENLPQQKMRLLRQHAPEQLELGQLQVDVYAGINAMILLWELDRYSGVSFHPCRRIDKIQGFIHTNPHRLLKIVGISCCLGVNFFSEYIGPHARYSDLSGCFLRNISLKGLDLTGVSFFDAYLRSADLSNSELQNAKFSWAILEDINLSDANLCDASFDSANMVKSDLSGANLSRANLEKSNLSSANLSFADLRNANFSGARFSNEFGTVLWSEETNWEGVKGLESAIGVPEALKQQLGLIEK